MEIVKSKMCTLRKMSEKMKIVILSGSPHKNGMRTLSYCMICANVHDEVSNECGEDVSREAICEQMGRVPEWADGLVLRADGYCTPFYKKD